jgi:hypothetical protein
MAMHKACWMMLFIFAALAPTAGLADDGTASVTNSETKAGDAVSAEKLVAVSKYESRWQLLPPIEALAEANDRPAPIANFLMQDTGAFARVSRLRYLSLLTLAESGQTRLFLGVNEHGLMGLHYGAFPRHADNRHLELIRMPYLKSAEAGEQDK